MESENKALKFNFSQKKFQEELYYHDQKGLEFLWSNFASSAILDKGVENFHLHFFQL